MKTTITLITLILLFGCKNQERTKVELTETKDVEIERPQSASLYELIKNKSEKSDSLPKRFDFSKKYTDKEIKELNLDTTKIGRNVYYLLTDQEFLKKQIDSISFLIYYKHSYGDQLEKLLRIKRHDTVFDLVLSMKGGDSSSYSISTEFENDSIFKKTLVITETAADNTDLMAYDIKTIITTFKYNDILDFQKVKKDSLRAYQEITYNANGKGQVFLENIKLLGQAGNKKVLYGIYSQSTVTERVSVYVGNVHNKSRVISIVPAGEYLDNIELLSIDQVDFIHVVFNSTSGNSNTYLYSLDLEKNIAKKVEVDYGSFKIPDSLSLIKGYGLSKEDNKFTSGGFLRSENNGNGYYLSREYKLVNLKDYEYVLRAMKQSITAE